MIVKRSLGVTIVLFCCLMNILLLRRELWPPPAPVLLHTVTAITEPMEEWWGIYYRGEKIGYAAQKITPETEGYLVRDSSLLRLNLLGTVKTVETRLQMTAAANWALIEFDFDLRSEDVRFKARGKVTAGKLHLEVESGGQRTDKELPMSQPPYLLAALKPYIVTQNLELGKNNSSPPSILR